MQAVQRIEREKRMDGGKEKEEADDPHTSAAKQKRPLRIGAELLLAERPSCACVAACIRHYFPRQGRRLEPRWRASREFHPSEVLSELRTGVARHNDQTMTKRIKRNPETVAVSGFFMVDDTGLEPVTSRTETIK